MGLSLVPPANPTRVRTIPGAHPNCACRKQLSILSMLCAHVKYICMYLREPKSGHPEGGFQQLIRVHDVSLTETVVLKPTAERRTGLDWTGWVTVTH